MKVLSVLISLLAFYTIADAQSADDWIWPSEAVHGYRVIGLDLDKNGDVWMGSGTKIIKYDGISWVAFDVLESGLSLANAIIYDIDIGQENKIWVSTYDRVIEYDLLNNIWTIHDPTSGDVNVNGSHIKVESENRIWWTTSSRLWEYNGHTWTSHSFHAEDIEINSSFRSIEIDQTKQKWLTTRSSFCIHGGCFTPAGLIRLSDSDTTFFDGITYGFPSAWATHVKLDSNDDPILVISEDSTFGNFFMKYTNDQWSNPVTIPFDGFVSGMDLGPEDQIYLAFRNFIVIYENGNWDIIPLNSSKISSPESLMVTPENDIYVGGRFNAGPMSTFGILGILPHLDYRIRGSLYSDRNGNGILDTEELLLKHQFVQTTNLDRLSFSNNDGRYSMLFKDPGTFTIEGLLPDYHSYSNPVDGRHIVTLTSTDPTSDSKDFGFIPDTSIIDLSLSLTAQNGANPGFHTCYIASVQNLAPGKIAGNLTLKFDELLIFESSDVIPTTIDGNDFTFQLDELDWLEIQNIQVCFLLPPDPELLGDTLIHTGFVTVTGAVDADPLNNYDTLSHIITGPYDPNFIEVYPSGEGIRGDISLTTRRLEYTIHFQNIGTDTARNVYITNPVHENLDVRTLKILGYSYPFELEYFEDGNLLKWSLKGINLPDSTVNPVGSNGFIKYSIDLAILDIGTEFKNQADIFFDFNLPITTNETINTLSNISTSVREIENEKICDFKVQYLEGNFIFNFSEINKYELSVHDMSGREWLHSFLQNDGKLQVPGNLKSGWYVVSIFSNNCRGSKKVYVE